MSSNLPPGCTSADGGIDHEFEAISEKLCNEANLDELRILLMLLPTVREIVKHVVTETLVGVMEHE